PGERAQDAIAAFDAHRERLVADALNALPEGDPLDAALALADAVEQVGDHPDLVAALSHIREPASQAAAARIERLLNENDPAGALELLARVRGALRSDRLDAMIDRAIVAQRLAESARFEAAGETADAMRAAVLAANIAPDDPAVRTAMTRLGLRTAAPATSTPRPSTTTTVNDNADDRLDALEREVRAIREARRLEGSGGGTDMALDASLRIDAIEQQVRTLEGVIDRYARSLADIESRQRLDGRAEYATDELDRRVRDLERTINDVRRSVSRVESDIRDLNRRIDRIR
ncbi:MAG: hypothetical protein ACTS27_12970, partial [Phycisphaerales bacterium]